MKGMALNTNWLIITAYCALLTCSNHSPVHDDDLYPEILGNWFVDGIQILTDYNPNGVFRVIDTPDILLIS